MKIPLITLAAVQPLHELVVVLVRSRDNRQRRPGAVPVGGYFDRALHLACHWLRGVVDNAAGQHALNAEVIR